MNFLVLCTGNSARSILLEQILSHRSDGRVRGYSAGSKPAGAVHPQSLTLLADMGYPTDGLRSKSWDEFSGDTAAQMDVVITVCGSAAGETCPVWVGSPVRAHWGVDDPAAADPANQPAAFREAYDLLLAKAEALFAQPFQTYDLDQMRDALNAIGRS